MALYDDPYKLRQPNVDITGGQQLPPVPNAPQNDLATQMATLIANMQSSPGGGTVTINQPTEPQPAVTPVPTATPSATPAPQDDLGAIIAKALAEDQSGGLKAAAQALQPATPGGSYDQMQAREGLAATAAEDRANVARTAAQRVAQEFPGQDASMFPKGLSKTIEGGRTFRALPSGGYSIVGGPTAASRAETARRGELLGQVNPLDYGVGTSSMLAPAPTTATLEALAARGTGTDTEQRRIRDRAQLARLGAAPRSAGLVPTGRGYRLAGTRPAPVDAMSNPAVLRAIMAGNYDPAMKRRAQQKLRRL